MLTFKLDDRELPYAIKEEMKMLRTNLLFCGEDKKVIMVTSVLADEGKSNVALNLCRSLAELGKTVLLVDCDLRKSVMLTEAGAGGTAKWGLSHFLAGQCNADEVLYWSGMDYFYVIPAVAYPPNPAELLSSVRMEKFLAAVREQFDYVIVDAPPLGLVVDAAILTSYCDGSVIVLETGRIPYRMAQNVASKLKNSSCPVLGVILNKVGLHKRGKYSGYYGGHYGKYYGGYGGYGYGYYGKDASDAGNGKDSVKAETQKK